MYIMKIIFSKKCLEYGEPGHPESPQRVELTHKHLKECGYESLQPNPAKDEDILSVHTEGLLRTVKSGQIFDIDTPSLPHIFDYAKLSVGSAIDAAELALKGENAFSLMRPPGHHATKNSVGGFCYFNNIAIAVQKTLGSIDRVAIIDIDCHHGNGTEHIFLGNQKVLYLSLHQSPLYPGTGLRSEKNCLNFPLLPGSDEKEYLEKLNQGLENVAEFDPVLIGISAGFDTYKGDPITNLNLEVGSYRKIAKLINEIKKPLFIVLEGGYSKEMPECVYQFLLGISK